MGSADWMPRNLDRRVEITFPVLDPSVRAKVRHILEVELEDTVRARIMKMDESGQYERIDKRGKVLVDSQEVFCNEAEEQAFRKMKVCSSNAYSSRLQQRMRRTKKVLCRLSAAAAK